jgi:hypothetical protein
VDIGGRELGEEELVGEGGGEWRHPDSEIPRSENRDHSYKANNEDGEENKDPRLAKRRKLPLHLPITL